jgi:hypothetical protein
MGRRCGCVGDECNCAIVPGRGIKFSGSGDTNNPLSVATTSEAHAFMQGRSTSNTDVNFTGEGTAVSPYHLSVDFNAPDITPLALTDYTSPGPYVWVRPETITMVEVYCIGGGESGAPGYLDSWSGDYYAGDGGDGGGWTYARIILPSEITWANVSVGAGGSAQPYPGPDVWSTPNIGAPSIVTFYTADGPTNLVVRANGGQSWVDTGAVGTQYGQKGGRQGSPPGTYTLFGGGGGGAGGEGSNSGQSATFIPGAGSKGFRGGEGGEGGDSALLSGAGIIYHGTSGIRGGGGGGGGAPTASRSGGNGGAGGNGAVRIVGF